MYDNIKNILVRKPEGKRPLERPRDRIQYRSET